MLYYVSDYFHNLLIESLLLYFIPLIYLNYVYFFKEDSASLYFSFT